MSGVQPGGGWADFVAVAGVGEAVAAMVSRGRPPLHATVARRALAQLESTWRGEPPVWAVLARSLVGIAVAWDQVERDETPRAVSTLAARYLDCLDRIVAGCRAGEGGDGVDGDVDEWSALAAELRAAEVGAEP
jgi:hypothetical protein